MENSESSNSLLPQKFVTAKSRWLADIPDLFVLLCSSILTGASIVLVAIIFHVQPSYIPFEPEKVPHEMLSVLQRAISTLSTTIASALIMVVGKRYVLYKLGRDGIQSRRAALYNRPSIGGLAYHLLRHGFEIPLLVLFTVWALGLAAGLTVNDAWGMVPVVGFSSLGVPFGALDGALAPTSPLLPAFEQLSAVMGSLCSGVAGLVGVINITGDMQLASGGPAGPLFYPPLPGYTPNSAFSVFAQLNSVNVSVEQLYFVPHTAQSLTCGGPNFTTGALWYEAGDNQTLSIVAGFLNSLYRFNASAIILGGILRSTGSAGTEFVPNGTTWPNVMSSDQWTRDIASLVCNVTRPTSSCSSLFNSMYTNEFGTGNGLINFAMGLNTVYSNSLNPYSPTAPGMYWSTALGMAMGAYSSNIGTSLNTTITFNDDQQFTPRYGVYILIANIVVSAIMLLVALGLRMASHLGGDFIDATRLLMDPLKNPELFDASLDTTIDARGNPWMSATKDGTFVLAEHGSQKQKGEWHWRRGQLPSAEVRWRQLALGM